ncbi:MAG: hypothetical protein A2667_00160 [Candidatus Wildermuthbacteria bacterium RIFCSPHIGHO2_01_FULL_47_27]|uniref:Uncharacterized protein n=1 Tax=Candidatus Wildermuthbacteria bacterium RIFCSPLOWO2_01_FULL_48_35 TaxID=1802463 RepID=A0A1G2RP37_9BACT|nr:MAG: hypothetical protein UY15_C0001G0057 [Parcubacteria group bacterium GW2011_GWA2_47_9]OHA63694.1 MAG: hypothetical protein A2667_00160 [Candidatus Wildermuthbacteria bacterium RIFCSPHIGHO2_01_FULL_47_27]OHA74630.1 MAG: hypothetical protein A3A32_01925 [Candidatus Wildermuthbacteria bacterium RIFCSPLOWO2_01_FULL_48_35]
MAQNIIAQYIEWHFYEAPREILAGWRNFLVFGLNYFSLPVLIKTLFSPWHRYRYEYGKQFDIGRWFEALTFNMMSRGIGAVLRAFLICFGALAETLIFFAGAVIFFFWLLLPFLIGGGFFTGLALLLF